MKDLFMDMQAKIGCPYLSDLPYYKRAVWFEMKRLCLSDYPKKQLEDFSRYASIFISFLYFGQYSGKLYENSIVIYFCSRFSSANRAMDPKRVFSIVIYSLHLQ